MAKFYSKNFSTGRIFKLFADGTVHLRKDSSEVGFVDEYDVRMSFDKKLTGMDLDMFIRNKISIPVMMKDRVDRLFEKLNHQPALRCSNMKKLSIDVLKQILNEREFENLIQKYLDFIKGKNKIEKYKTIDLMYKDHLSGMSFDEVAKKYGHKTVKRVGNLIANYALELNKRGMSSNLAIKNTNKLMVLGTDDKVVEKYISEIKDVVKKDILERFVLKKQRAVEIAEYLQISIGYFYKLKTDALKEIAEISKR